MHNTYFDLGSRKTNGTGISKKAYYLDLAAHARLGVPRGLVIRGEALLEALLLGLLDENPESGEITCPRPHALADWLDFPTFSALVRVVSAFGIEDQQDLADQGIFPDIPHVNLNDAADIANALCTIWSSAEQAEGDFRRDLLIMEMIPAQKRGIAFSQHDYADDLIQWAEQEGAEENLSHNVLLPQLWRIEGKADAHLEDWQQRLQQLLRKIRITFGHQDWQIAWADDGNQCYVISIQAAYPPPKRDEVFIQIDYHEVLGSRSGLFFADLVASCSERFKKQYRSYDPAFPEDRPLIELHHTSPYLNLSLLADMQRILGLTTARLPLSGNIHQRKIGRNLMKVLQGVLPRMLLSNLRERKAIDAAHQKIRERMQQPGTTWEELIITARWLYITYVVTLGALPLMSALLPRNMQKNSQKREAWKVAVRQELGLVWQTMLDKADTLVTQEILPEADVIWQMTIGELCQLDTGWKPDSDFFIQRQNMLEEQQPHPFLAQNPLREATQQGREIARAADERENPQYETLYDFSANKQIRIISRHSND